MLAVYLIAAVFVALALFSVAIELVLDAEWRREQIDLTKGE